MPERSKSKRRLATHPNRNLAAGKLFGPPPQPDYGRLVHVEIIKTSDKPIVCKLKDGTVLEIKVLIADVSRSLNRFNLDGDPLYVVKSAQIIKSKVPPKLRRGKK